MESFTYRLLFARGIKVGAPEDLGLLGLGGEKRHVSIARPLRRRRRADTTRPGASETEAKQPISSGVHLGTWRKPIDFHGFPSCFDVFFVGSSSIARLGPDHEARAEKKALLATARPRLVGFTTQSGRVSVGADVDRGAGEEESLRLRRRKRSHFGSDLHQKRSRYIE